MEELSLGERIKQARLERGLTQKELAEKSGLGETTISGYENNLHDPTLFAATCIAQVLDVTLDWLAGRKDSQ